MMTVGYEVTSLAENRYGGIATVCRHTLKQAVNRPSIEPTALYRRGSADNFDEIGIQIRKISWRDHFRLSRYDVLHALCHRIPPVRHRRLVYTLHDAWSLYPNRYQSPDFQRKIGKRITVELRRADAVVCDSRATLERLDRLQIVDPARCQVVYPGVDPTAEWSSGLRSTELSQLLSAKFVLFVGRIEVRKNLEHVIDAIIPLSDLHLVVVGEWGYGGREISAGTLSRLPMERLHRLERVSGAELSLLYSKATAALQPSWEEGFGLPMLEAMVHGCPLITSNCSASAEVAGDAAILVDPAESAQSTAALQQLLKDGAARTRWAEAGRVRSQAFTWSAYFEGLLNLYTNLG